MKYFFLIIMMLFLQSCGAFWRGTIYNKPSVGDSKHFSQHHYFSDLQYPFVVNKLEVSCGIDFKKSRTDFLMTYEKGVVNLLYGDIDSIYEPYELFSVTKSVVSLLIGIALTDKKINALDDNINDYVSNLDASLKTTTIRDLLQMRSGMNNNFYLKTIFYYGTNLNWSISQARVRQSTIGEFQYSDCSTQLLASAIEKAVGKSVQEYFYEKLWVPLEMVGEGSWTLDSKKHGNARAFCGLCLSPINLIKIGVLVMNDGRYKDVEVVSPNWMKTISHVEIRERSYIDNRYYNYHWRCSDDDILYAKGLFGQYLYVNKITHKLYLRLGKSEGEINWISYFENLSRMDSMV